MDKRPMLTNEEQEEKYFGSQVQQLPLAPIQPPPSTVTTVSVVAPQQYVHYGPENQLAVCPHCKIQMRTRVESKVTTKTHLMALLLCCLLCLPCVWLPYCCASCQNRVHSCSNCGEFLGVYTN